MCEACDNDAPGAVEVVIEFPATGATYSYEEFGVYAYDEHPPSSVLAGQSRRRARGTYERLEDAQREHPRAVYAGGSGFSEVVIPQAAPAWFDSAAAGESWTED